ncbi:low-affinity phosphate transporter [Hypoxylon texense]
MSADSAPPAPTEPPTPTPTTHLKATYTNSHSANISSFATQSFEIATPLSLPEDASSTEQKTAYLRRLRDAVSDLQSRVNSELTARMEDEARSSAATAAATAGNKAGNGVNGVGGVDEEAEEENYGEEVVGDDDE